MYCCKHVEDGLDDSLCTQYLHSELPADCQNLYTEDAQSLISGIVDEANQRSSFDQILASTEKLPPPFSDKMAELLDDKLD